MLDATLELRNVRLHVGKHSVLLAAWALWQRTWEAKLASG
jgi:hypothetical protein